MRRCTQQGLTLLEVLVAMVIIAIALTAIIKASTENIRSTHYLEQKMQATWVGLMIVNKARLELLTLPKAPEQREEEVVSLNQHWAWQGHLKETPNHHIQEIQVTVFELPTHQRITTLRGYRYGN